MKKLILIILILLTTGCIYNQKDKGEEQMTDELMTNIKSLVLYFSVTGNTKKIATTISKLTNSDIEEIIPLEPYTNEDIDYQNNKSRANREQNDKNARPKIKNEINVSKYETIYLGYPIWWGTSPRIILTLLDNIDLEGKNIILFCTSGSSEIEESMLDLKKYKPNINWVTGKRLSSNATSEEIENWLETTNNKIYIKINNQILTATLNNNSSSKSLIEKLKEKDIKLQMSDYGNFEKVGSLDFSLPRNDEQITTKPGDIILYQGDKITIYYDTNNWNFTKLGKIDNLDELELKEILGPSDVEVTFSLNK